MAKQNLVDMEALKENLKKRGYKLTHQRRAIVDTIIENEGKHLTAEEIYDEVKKDCPEIGLATVYRTVLLLEDLKVVSRVDLSDGCSRYELIHADEIHRHHHLICSSCHNIFEVQEDLLENLEHKIETAYHFKILNHSVTFYGLCDKCQKKADAE